MAEDPKKARQAAENAIREMNRINAKMRQVWHQYIEMMTAREHQVSGHDKLADVHTQGSGPIHGAAAFLPWQRLFQQNFEQTLGRLTQGRDQIVRHVPEFEKQVLNIQHNIDKAVLDLPKASGSAQELKQKCGEAQKELRSIKAALETVLKKLKDELSK